MNYGLHVTDIYMKIKDDKGMKAICNIVVNGMLCINDIRVIENKDGKLFIAMPSKKMPDGKFKDSCNPANAQARNIIETAILNEYHRMTTLSDELAALIGL